jgi:hypothetical protein
MNQNVRTSDDVTFDVVIRLVLLQKPQLLKYKENIEIFRRCWMIIFIIYVL